jgi:hypothetical protein
MKTSDSMTCEAFKRALPHIAQQSLDSVLQVQISLLHQQLERLQQSSSADAGAEIAAKIRALVEQDPDLAEAYQNERQKLQKAYRESDRAKGIAVNFDDSFFAQKNIAKTSNFWEKGDRVLVMGAGGAILGAMFAQIPGAVVGGILAGLYGWYIEPGSSSKTNYYRKTK